MHQTLPSSQSILFPQRVWTKIVSFGNWSNLNNVTCDILFNTVFYGAILVQTLWGNGMKIFTQLVINVLALKYSTQTKLQYFEFFEDITRQGGSRTTRLA